MTKSSEEIKNNKNAVAAYTCGILCYVLIGVLALFDLFRGIPIWSLSTVFFASSATYSMLKSNAKYTGIPKDVIFKVVMALISFIFYFVFK